MAEICVIGLGPGAPGLITRDAWKLLETVRPLFLRTAKHPTVSFLVEQGINFESFDRAYEEESSFEAVYRRIIARLLAEAQAHGRVLYAVPGSPFTAEQTVVMLRDQAGNQGIKLSILPGMSFLELMYDRLAVDPVSGVTVLDAADVDKHRELSDHNLIITQVYDRRIASDLKLSLMEEYPDEYEISLVRNLGLPDEEIRRIPLYMLDRQPCIDHLTSVFVPPLNAKSQTFSLDPLIGVMARLRSPGGCVWDLEQDHPSLRRYIVEEVYEVLEAIENQDAPALCEELGDLLLQIVFHARIAEEAGEFSMQDVVDTVTEKMIRRHPHVFGKITVKDAAEVLANWDIIKKHEKGHERKSVLDGIPGNLPSLQRAYKLQTKAAKAGFDWDEIGPVKEKILEELHELEEAIAAGSNQEGELGDLLFAVVNLGRFLDIDAEVALTATNNKFIRRFSHVENRVCQSGREWKSFSLADLDAFWEEAKASELTKR